MDSHKCSVCGVTVGVGQPEMRCLRINDGKLRIGAASKWLHRQSPDEHRATACGQQHALILTGRFLERGSFEKATHVLPEPQPVDAYADLT